MPTLVTRWYCPFQSFYAGPITFPTAGSISGTPISWCCPAPLVSQIKSLQYPWIFILVTWLLSLSPVITLQKCFSFCPCLAGPLYRTLVLLMASIQHKWRKYCSNCLIFKFSVKMYQHIKCDVPRMLQTSFIISCLPSWMTWHIYHIFISASWWCAAWNFKINNQNLATFEVNTNLWKVCVQLTSLSWEAF